MNTVNIIRDRWTGNTSDLDGFIFGLYSHLEMPSISLSTPRPNWEETVADLEGLGADIVTTEARCREDMSELNNLQGGWAGSANPLSAI